MKRLLCMLLVAVMLMTSLAFSAFAEEITYTGEIVLGEWLSLDLCEGAYYSFEVTEAMGCSFKVSSYLDLFEVYLDGTLVYGGAEYAGYFKLEPGSYDVKITNKYTNNSICIDKIPVLDSFDINKSQLNITAIEYVDLRYYFSVAPRLEYVYEYKVIVDDESVVEIEDNTYVIPKKAGETLLTVTAIDYYGNEFTDTVKIAVMPNYKWDFQETGAASELRVYAYSGEIGRALEFTVPETGLYRIYSDDDSYDPYATLYCNGEYVTEKDDCSEDYNFEIIQELTAGETYELLVNFYDDPGNTLVFIEKYAPVVESVPAEIALCIGDVYNMADHGVSSLTVVTDESASDDEAAVDAVIVDGSEIIAVADGEAIVEYFLDGEYYTITVNVVGTRELESEKTSPVRVDNFYTSKVYSFTAPEAGNYCFGTKGDTDTCGTLYDSDGDYLYSDDDEGLDLNFYISYELEAGQTVYVQVYTYRVDKNQFDIFAAKKSEATGIKIVLDEGGYFAVIDGVYYTVYDDTPSFEVEFLESYGAVQEYYEYDYVKDEEDPTLRTLTVTTDSGLTDSVTVKLVELSMGDINLDGVFDDADYLCFKENFDNPDVDLPDSIRLLGDFNYDMIVERSDVARMFAILAEKYGHDYKLTQNGNVIEASCTVGRIECPEHSGTVVSVSAASGEYNGRPFTAELTNLIPEDMLDWSVSEVYYVGTGDTVYEATTQAPTEVGTYKAYVTISDYEAYAEFSIAEPAPEYNKGDINMNGRLDARDYLLLKRAFFKTYTLQCTDEIADINDNGRLDARDYLLLKRAFFKTYTIK